MDEVGGTAEVGEPPEDDKEVVAVSTLAVLHVLCDSGASSSRKCIGVAGTHSCGHARFRLFASIEVSQPTSSSSQRVRGHTH